MAFRYMPTLCLAGAHPGGAVGSDYYVGYGSDAGLYLYAFAAKYTMAAQFGNGYKVDGSALAPASAAIGGYIYFNGSGLYLFQDAAYGWVIKASLAPCLEYWEWTDPSNTSLGGSYAGSAFWTGSLPTSSNTTFLARGQQRGTVQNAYNGTAKTLSYFFDRWEAKTTQFGEYEPKGAASGNKVFGVPQWANGSALYPRSIALVDGKFSYGAIAWNSTAGKYVLGSYGSASGWNESGSAPAAGSSWTLSFAKPEGSEATGSSVTLSWSGYIQGTETAKCYIQNAGVFLP